MTFHHLRNECHPRTVNDLVTFLRELSGRPGDSANTIAFDEHISREKPCAGGIPNFCAGDQHAAHRFFIPPHRCTKREPLFNSTQYLAETDLKQNDRICVYTCLPMSNNANCSFPAISRASIRPQNS